jgi:hypothetical protein
MYNFSYVAHTHTCTHTPHHTTPHHTVNYVLQVPIMYVQYLPSHHGLVIRTWRLCQLFSSGEPPARHSGHACLGLRRARDRLAFAAYHTRQSIAVRTCSLSSCLSRSHPQSYDAPRLYSFPRIPPPRSSQLPMDCDVIWRTLAQRIRPFRPTLALPGTPQ